MAGQNSGCSCTPDYNMRRRNQDCGCRRTPRSVDRSGMSGRPQPPRQGCCHQGPGPRQFSDMAPQSSSSDIDQFPVGMTYVPWQTWQNIYEAEYGLRTGTIFGDLDYPWEVGRCVRK